MIRFLRAIALAIGVAAGPLAAVTTAVAPAPAQAAGARPKVSAIVVDAESGDVMYASRADRVRYPASLTKVMTLYLTFEALAAGQLELSDRISVSRHAASRPPSKIGLRPGDTLSVEDAIDLLIVKSANDVAAALAEKLGGSESKFAARMTKKARELGMDHTRFVNASGLPASAQVSTARDMAVLARAMLRDFPQYYELFDQEQTRFRGRPIRGHNRLLKTPGVDGMKTGYTRAAGFNLMTSAAQDDRRLVAVVLGGATARSRDAYMRELLAAGFEVAERNAKGESVKLAELLHGATPGNAPIEKEIAQGDADDIVTSRAGAAGGWVIQVGAFSSRGRGESLLTDLVKRFPRRLKTAERRLTRSGRLHVVGFSGFTADAARETCGVLKSRGAECLVVGPGGPSA